jgi:hypothetical protein
MEELRSHSDIVFSVTRQKPETLKKNENQRLDQNLMAAIFVDY